MPLPVSERTRAAPPRRDAKPPRTARAVAPAATQIARLLTIVIFAVHFFACAFWRVASYYRTPEELDAWLSGKHVPADVSRPRPAQRCADGPARAA